MMLMGNDVRPVQAKKMGLVDLVVSEHQLEGAAIAAAEELASGKLKVKVRRCNQPLRYISSLF